MLENDNTVTGWATRMNALFIFRIVVLYTSTGETRVSQKDLQDLPVLSRVQVTLARTGFLPDCARALQMYWRSLYYVPVRSPDRIVHLVIM